MSTPSHVAVVGASAAGLTVVERLRRRGFEGAITLIGAESELPYDRPPLSKKVLAGEWHPERVALRAPDEIRSLGCDLRLGLRAIGLDAERRRLSLEGGEVLPYGELVIATGVSPRHLASGHELEGVHVLRTLEDSLALRASMLRGGPLVVIGAGPLGTEVAATARAMRLPATLVDALPSPMLRHVGPAVSARLAELHRERGVRLEFSTVVDRLVADGGRVAGVQLGDGRVVEAATVLVSIGSTAAVDWLRGSSVPIGNGVVCNEYSRAAEHIWAAGDVAEWFNPRFGARMRVEHRMNATEQGALVADNILGAQAVFAPLPYFWTDQYEIKIQGHGMTSMVDATLDPDPDDDRRFGARYVQGGQVVGILGWNASPKHVRGLRGEVGQPVGVAKPEVVPA